MLLIMHIRRDFWSLLHTVYRFVKYNDIIIVWTAMQRDRKCSRYNHVPMYDYLLWNISNEYAYAFGRVGDAVAAVET